MSFTCEIKYIDNDKKLGILYDWKKIYKTLDKLDLIPKGIYYPSFNFNLNKWNLVLSERSVGKTTSALLLGLVMHEMYGTIIHYVREDLDMIMPKSLSDLFNVIIESGYVERITQGKWNSVFYNSRRWYYCNVDEFGKVLEKDSRHFMFCMALDQNTTYKSSYSCETGDLIIFDEFISKRYMRNDFIDLCDIISTVKRARLSTVIIMLANTIDITSEYFDELEIREYVDKMELGESVNLTTENGTNIYVEIYKANQTKNKKKSIREYFGFKNERLGSITGTGWATDNYPHIKNLENVNVIDRRFYIRTKGHTLRIDIATCDIGIVGLCHYGNIPNKEDALIYTISDIEDKRERYRFGRTKVDDFLWNLYRDNKIYYANNLCGSLLKSYVNMARKMG